MSFKEGDRVRLKSGTRILSDTDTGTIKGVSPATGKWIVQFDTFSGPDQVRAREIVFKHWSSVVVTSTELVHAHASIPVAEHSVQVALEFGCECGTKNQRGQGHSGWCKLYQREFV